MRGRHLSRLSGVVVDGLLADHQDVDLVLLGQRRQNFADVERLQGLHLGGRNLNVNAAVGAHGQSSSKGFLQFIEKVRSRAQRKGGFLLTIPNFRT